MKLLSIEQLRQRVPVSRTKLNMMVAQGEFPAPIQMLGRLAFCEAEVDAWIEKQPRGLYQQKPALRQHQVKKSKEVA